MSLPKTLITGSSSGLGFYLAQYFSSKGHPVLLHGRNKQRILELKNQIEANNGKVDYFISDLTKQEEVLSLASYAREKNVEVLINNAGVTCYSKPLEDLRLEQINEMIDTNLKAPIILVKQLLPFLKHIININSMVGLEFKKYRTLYSASKWGLRGFSNSLRLECDMVKILDFYPTNMQTWPGRENSMDINFVMDSIYTAYMERKEELVLDGRKSSVL